MLFLYQFHNSHQSIHLNNPKCSALFQDHMVHDNLMDIYWYKGDHTASKDILKKNAYIVSFYKYIDNSDKTLSKFVIYTKLFIKFIKRATPHSAHKEPLKYIF